MKLNSKNICIITHQFPPYGKVAGRRWLLFAKQLERQGASVKIITSKGLIKESPWNPEGFDAVYLKDNYPKTLNSTGNSIFYKLSYRFWTLYLKFRFNGNPFDKGLFWLRKVKEFIVSRDFAKDTIFVLSGAPFSLFKIGRVIARRGFQYILDYRDPHTWNNGYGYNQLSLKRQKFEKDNEIIAAKGAVKIIFPNHEMITEYCNIYPEFLDKCEVLAHPLDEQSITTKWEIKEVNLERINLVYAGTLYDNSIKEFKNLIKWIETNPNIHLTIFTHKSLIPPDLIPLLDAVSRIYLKEAIAAKDIYTILNGFDAYLIVQSYAKRNYVTTKFVDLVYFGIPTIVHCAEGKLTEVLSPINYIRGISTFYNFDIAYWLGNISFNKAAVEEFLEEYSGKIEI